MITVMNELEYATDLLNGGKIECGDKHALSTLAKYCRYYDMSNTQAKQTLSSWYKERFPDCPKSQCDKSIVQAIKSAEKYPLIAVDEIIITKPEIERILSIESPKTREGFNGCHGKNSKSLKKIAFTLLCFAKFELAKGRDEPWVNIPYKDLFKIARVRVTNDLKTQYIKDLIDLGFVEPTMRASSYLLKVLFVEDGDTAVAVDNLSETGALFEQVYLGKKLIKCKNCGAIIKQTTSNKKYCKKCAKIVDARKKLEKMRKTRNERKASQSAS